jgi:hypothetical protein
MIIVHLIALVNISPILRKSFSDKVKEFIYTAKE